MNIIEYVTSLANLVLWSAGQRPLEAAQEAWKTISDGGKTTTALLPSKEGWVEKVVENDGYLNWQSFLDNSGPFGVLLEALLPDEAVKLVEEAQEAAAAIVEEVKTKVVGGYVVAGVAGVTLLAVVVVAVVVARKKKKKKT